MTKIENISGKSDQEIQVLMDQARKNNVHIDVAVNPFIDEVTRQSVINKKEQDPEWD